MVIRKLVQIKGSNGSGKSTIARQLQSVSDDVVVHKEFTVLRDLGWTLIGKYKIGSKMGGCDGLKSVAEIKAAIILALSFTFNWVLFEGMMISTIKSTFYEYLLELAHNDTSIQPVFVILQADYAACIERIRLRGTMKENLKVDNIRAKCALVTRHARTYDQQYVKYMDVDRIPVQHMLGKFLRTVDDQANKNLWR